MDISELSKVNEASNSGVWVNIKDPNTGDELPIKFKVRGSTSDEFYRLKDKLQTEMLTASVEGKEIDSDELGMRLVAGMVVDIEGLEKDKKPMKDAMQVFKTEGLRFIFQQLDVEIKRKANFTKPDSAS